jgi:peptidoglycan/LPS O-acetylase OafA/YrhL
LTIAYEFRCYVLVAVLGVCGLLRRPSIWLALTVLLLYTSVSPGLQKLFFWHSHYLVTGAPSDVYRLTSAFLVGGCFYLFRKYIPFRPLFALGAGLALGLALLEPWLFEQVLIVCGGYLLFYLTSLDIRFPARAHGFPDISYGLYLYGWPIQMLWIWHFHGSPWVAFAGTLVLSACFGWLSWHYIERPMLTLKPKLSVPLTA